MAWTTADLTAIETAIAMGELTVEIGDKRITYRSMDDLLKARATISQALGAAGVTTGTPSRSYAAFNRDQ